MDTTLRLCISPTSFTEVQQELQALLMSPHESEDDLGVARLYEPTETTTSDETAASMVCQEKPVPSEEITQAYVNLSNLREMAGPSQGPSTSREAESTESEPKAVPLFLPVKQDLCWRCGTPGHRRQGCTNPPMLFCSRCGKTGVMSRGHICQKLFPQVYTPVPPRNRDRKHDHRSSRSLRDVPRRRRCPTCHCPNNGQGCRR